MAVWVGLVIAGSTCGDVDIIYNGTNDELLLDLDMEKS
jgi:hypothetical protein